MIFKGRIIDLQLNPTGGKIVFTGTVLTAAYTITITGHKDDIQDLFLRNFNKETTTIQVGNGEDL